MSPLIFCGRRSFTFSGFAVGVVADEGGFKLFVDHFRLAPAEDFLHVAAHLFSAEHGAKECSWRILRESRQAAAK